MVNHHLQKFARSFQAELTADRVGDVPGGTPIQLTIVLKPHASIDTMRPIMSREDYGRRHGTRQAVVDDLVEYVRSHGLQVEHADAATHLVRLSGTYAQAQSAFEPEGVGVYRVNAQDFIARSGYLAVPAHLAENVVAVMGFDQRPIAWPHFRIRPLTTPAKVSYNPADIATRYGFPADLTGANQTIALIELGGGYDPARMSDYFTAKNIKRLGTLEAVPVGGVQNQPPSDPGGPDGEVQLDIEVAGSIAPSANIAVYFGSNAGSGFLDAIAAAVHDTQRTPSVISISWGGPETGWAGQDVDAMDQLFQTAASLGITICAASGDSGASDGGPQGTLTVDFPASSPHVLGCGGTRLPRQGAETAWNDGTQGGATGGGYSTHFNRPDWQSGNSQPGRGVPDVAGDADPVTGYNVTINGQDTVVGGTSAVAPLWAGLIALINQSLKTNVGFVNPALYARPDAMTDIITGNNNGFRCSVGWDPVTGLGSPKGDAILAVLKAGSQAVA
ncbi:S53 family peptidase [Rhodopila sp.]|uniref:S53 family peptidase n=1 Tax=Rhodopila sp. TaxID=2480087 RepID=UPI003D0E9C16